MVLCVFHILCMTTLVTLSLQSDFLKHALHAVLPWTMVYHFNTRAYATGCLVTLWRHCKDSGLTDVLGEHAVLESVLEFHQRNAKK